MGIRDDLSFATGGPSATTQEVSGRPDVMVSLVPQSLVELGELIGFAWGDVALPARMTEGAAGIALDALNLLHVRDLANISPLTLLALARAVSPESPGGGLWAEATETGMAVSAAVLPGALTEPFAHVFMRSLAGAAPSDERPHDSGPELNECALCFDQFTMIDAMRDGAPLTGPQRVWLPSGARHVEAPEPHYPWQAPLLSHVVRDALVASGRDLGCALSGLPWLSQRTLTSLRNERQRTRPIRTLAELVSHTPEELFGRRQFGPKTYLDVITTLRIYLNPWLAALPSDLLLGGQTDETPPSLAPPAPAEDPPAPTDPFAALLISDLIAALDLYDMPWSDMRVETLAPQSAARWAASTAQNAAPSPQSPLAPQSGEQRTSLDQAGYYLAQLAPLMATKCDEQSLFDLTLGELVTATPAWDAYMPTERLEELLCEMVVSLTALLLRHALRPEAYYRCREDALAALRQVSMADLLSEWLLTPGRMGRRLKPVMIDILAGRNGLLDGEIRTLEDMGARMGITRERVRQLEKSAYELLADPRHQMLCAPLGRLVQAAARALDGVATLAAVAEWIGALIPMGDVDPRAVTRFLARWQSDATMTHDHALIVASPYTEALVLQTQEAIRSVLRARHELVGGELILQAGIAGGAAVMDAGAGFVAATLATMDDVALNGDTYQPSGYGTTKSRIVVAMRSLGRPARVAEIAAEYRRLYPHDPARHDNSIRAFFDRFPDTFVLVGMSAYALSEWGYDPAIRSISALVESILGQSSEPMRQEEVVEQAEARYFWKAQSIRAQFATNPHIRGFGGGYFGLSERHAPRTAPVGLESWSRASLVTASYTNTHSQPVLQLRLTPHCVSAQIPLSNQPMREMFPTPGKIVALGWRPDEDEAALTLTCSRRGLSGLRLWLLEVGARAGDTLFIERLTPSVDGGAPTYRFAVAAPDALAEAMLAVGLSVPESDTPVGAYGAMELRYARKPRKVIALLEYAVEHPWMTPDEAAEACNVMASNPAATEYLWLARVTGMLASGRVPTGDRVVRPTTQGRAWAFAPGMQRERAERLMLTAPAYRAHVRSLGMASSEGAGAGDGRQRIGRRVLEAWDKACDFTRSQSVAGALEGYPAIVMSDVLDDATLSLLLLLLAAQSQGRGLAREAIDSPLGGRVAETLGRLRALGLALAEDDLGRVALAERVWLALAASRDVESTLAAGSGAAGAALAQAWESAVAGASPRQPLCASSFYSELQGCAPALLYDALTAPPTSTPEFARSVDAPFPFCGFPPLVADWAQDSGAASAADASRRETIVTYAMRADRQPEDTPMGVALCDDLLARRWDAGQSLAGNAHLTLLTVIAADEGNLADRLRRADAGWHFAGVPLIPALDALLRALGFDPWDELYRGAPDRMAGLADGLVALAERLNLVEAHGVRLTVESGLATRVYYEACGRGFTDRIAAALAATPADAALPVTDMRTPWSLG